MKLTVFHAADGDCLLLASRGRRPRYLLVDGGRKDSYGKHTRDVLGRLRAAGRKLDVVCVSHIDDDHISGIRQLVEDEVEWRAFEFRSTIQPGTRAPRVLRPPVIGEVWHNGLFKLIGDDIGVVVEPVLSTMATMLAGSPRSELRAVASELDNLAHGEASSMELTRRLSDRQLMIPLNPRTGGALVKRATTGARAAGEHVTLGSLEIFLLGPS
ncbi:MAG: MBL fold metallo-hydrolase, partial [Vicinamibacterales bacterium]